MRFLDEKFALKNQKWKSTTDATARCEIHTVDDWSLAYFLLKSF